MCVRIINERCSRAAHSIRQDPLYRPCQCKHNTHTQCVERHWKRPKTIPGKEKQDGFFGRTTTDDRARNLISMKMVTALVECFRNDGEHVIRRILIYMEFNRGRF